MVRAIFSDDYRDDETIRKKIKKYIMESYKCMNLDVTKSETSDKLVIFQKGQYDAVKGIEIPKVSEKTRVETYVTDFEGIKVGELFSKKIRFDPIECEMTLLGAIQYRISKKILEKDYKVDIGQYCGEESIRLIRISTFSYDIKTIM
jgi:hypothetical protein